MHFVKVPIKFLRKKCPQYYIPVDDKKEPSGKFDLNLQRLVHFSQIGLVVLGVVGYYYTILPVFQHQLLQEKAANLEIENLAAQKQLASLLKQQSTVKEDILALREQLEKELAHSDLLSKNMSELKKQKYDAENKAKNAEEKLRQDIFKLEDITRWKSILSSFLNAYSSIDASCCRSNGFMRDFGSWNSMDDTTEKPGNFILKEEKYWPKPQNILLKAIEVIAQENNEKSKYPLSYYNELRASVNAKENALSCERPNFNSLYAEFTAALIASEPSINAELDFDRNFYQNQIASRENPKLTEDLLLLHKQQIREKKVLELEYLYDKKITALRDLCDKKANMFFKEIMGEKGVRS